ncbi:MAG TPA: hypothetical protein PLV68_18095, partial [Ilumatobacteraceae bacterium]|nr:hypothetical protein [Ilumatobacteraceae bacterium]
MALIGIVGSPSGLVYRNSLAIVQRQREALDRVGRLYEANGLLFELQRVAQTLPASLDLDDVLDSTAVRLVDLIDHSMCTVLLVGDAPRRFETARARGYTSRY